MSIEPEEGQGQNSPELSSTRKIGGRAWREHSFRRDCVRQSCTGSELSAGIPFPCLFAVFHEGIVAYEAHIHLPGIQNKCLYFPNKIKVFISIMCIILFLVNF